MRLQPAWAWQFGTIKVECKNQTSLDLGVLRSVDPVSNSESPIKLSYWLDCRTSVGHLDSPDVVETGLTQMLSLVVDQNSDEMLEVLYSLILKRFGMLM